MTYTGLHGHRSHLDSIINGSDSFQNGSMGNGDERTTLELKIDLYNFEDPEFEDSKYVLTSPRSLEACAKHGVKPVDLLYKPLAEFQEELLPQDIPLRTIYNIYDEQEQERQRKLKQCRDERNKLERETTKKAQSTPKRRPASSRSYTSKASARSRLFRSQSDEDIKVSGSLQRQRTAWATSVGHKRVTPDSLNDRVKQLHEESMKLRNELLSRKEGRPRTPSRPRTPKAKTKNLTRSRSASSLALSGSMSSLNRSTIRDARPISSPSLKKTLSSSSINLNSVCVTPRDEKILELMATKGEQEKAMARDRYMADLAWELQRKKEEEAKMSTETKRRHLLAEENRIKKMKQMELEQQRLNLEAEMIEEREKMLAQKSKKWDRMYTAQQKMKDLQLEEQKQRDKLKKVSQERSKKLLENDEAEMQELILRQQARDIQTAAQRKEALMFQESMRKIMDNKNERNQFESKKKALEKSTEFEVNQLRNSVDKKHKQAEINFTAVARCKESNIRQNQLEREKKALSAKLSQKKLDMELEEWRGNVIDHRKTAEQHAIEVSEKKKDLIARKAHADRTSKEQLLKQNQKKNKEG